MRLSVLSLSLSIACSVCFSFPVFAQSERVAQQVDGYEGLPDRTDELQAMIERAEGRLELVDAFYRISRPLIVDLETLGASSLSGQSRSTIIMDGPGPAFLIRGTHDGTASPKSFKPQTWNQRMPTLSDLEILGAHPNADGVQLEGTVGAILRGVSVRWTRHAVRLEDRNRNVIISSCHLYQNSGIGLFLNDVNLHQINVVGCHISYNQGGGIVVRDGNVRNLQVAGCDLEANMPLDETPTRAANLWIDVSGSADDKTRSIAEVSITGCTIQHSANYSGSKEKTVAPGGANIRLTGKSIYPIDSVTITGNVLSDTTINLDLEHVMDVTVSANTFFAPKPQNIRVVESQRVILQGNTFNPRQFVRPGKITFEGCRDCLIANSTLHHLAASDGSLEIVECDGISVAGLVLSDCGTGIVCRNSKEVLVSGCLVRGTQSGPDLKVDEASKQISVLGNHFQGSIQVPPDARYRSSVE